MGGRGDGGGGGMGGGDSNPLQPMARNAGLFRSVVHSSGSGVLIEV